MNGHLQKRLCDQLHNVFTGIHSMRSLTSAARPVLAVLRHIRSSVRSASDNTSSRVGNWAFYARILGTFVPEMTSREASSHNR
jgi:hypothetical protein